MPTGAVHREPFRLASGGIVDRTKPIPFRLNGRAFNGLDGDTVASALLANGEHLVGRSFKYHGPRGIFGAGFEDAGCLVESLGTLRMTNTPASVLPLTPGLELRSVNCWPGPRFDVGALAHLFAPLLPAGFYYKTFMWPRWLWFEPWIRRAAGLGTVPSGSGSDLVWESLNAHCDVLVIGGGAAGLTAALAAARAGARVIVADDGLSLGGRLVADGRRLDGAPATAWIARVADELRANPRGRVFERATVWGYHEHNLLTLLERRPSNGAVHMRNWRIRARQVVIATGAIERPIAFQDNDRPGVMLASAVRTYVNRHAVLPGRRVVVFTNNDSAYAAAVDLARVGAEVTVVDSRQAPSDPASSLTRAAGIEFLPGAVVRRARGGHHVGAVEIGARRGGAFRLLRCDLVAVSGGWNPAIHLASQSREAKAVWDERHATFVAHHASRRFRLAGAANGRFDLAGCLAEGAAAGVAAAEAAGFRATMPELPHAEAEPAYAIEALWHVPARGGRSKMFVDMAGDVTVGDLALAMREGYDGIELIKRYTTAGMGVDQGKTGNVNVIGVAAGLAGVSPESVGTTTFRPPFVPVEFGAIAGHRAGARLLPRRHTPLTPWHIGKGAVMNEAGLRWQRPGCYPRAGEGIVEATHREARAVRHAVGVYDGTPLGKYQVKGHDAGAFLDLVYINDFAGLAPGRGRYGVMLTEDGLLLDDGVTFRLDEDRWLMHGSTGNAERVYQHLEQVLQVHRPDLRVTVIPVTSQWGNATLCGPRAREVLSALAPDFDIAGPSFPFMSFREGTLGGLPVRVFRVSYTGELSFEINTPARHLGELWERIIAAGRPFGVEPIGSEANHLLRVEAGYLSFGHEVDGTADPFDLGLGRLVSRRKADFIGKRAMEIRRRHEPDRRELVGLLPEDSTVLVPEGCPITPGGRKTDSEGFVSACVASVALDRAVALGLLMRGRSRIGETVFARANGKIFPLTVVEPVFYDADRRRVRS